MVLDFVYAACGECLPALDTRQVTATATFHEPAASSWLDELADAGACVVGSVYATPAGELVDVGATAELATSAAAISLTELVPGVLTSEVHDETVYETDAAYDLVLHDGGDWGPFEIAEVLQTPSDVPLDQVEPTYLIETELSAAMGELDPADASFSLGTSSTPAALIVQIIATDADSGEVVGELHCVGPDDAPLTVPEEAFDTLPTGATLQINLQRFTTTTVEHPVVPGLVQGVVFFGVAGTASLVR